MFSHVCLGCTDLPRAQTFYRAVLPQLGLTEMPISPDLDAFVMCWTRPDDHASRLFIGLPENAAPATAGNGTMVALVAPSRAAVDAAHATAMDLGATDEGAPGPRPHYGPDYYGAYLRDPDGNKLHFVHMPGI